MNDFFSYLIYVTLLVVMILVTSVGAGRAVNVGRLRFAGRNKLKASHYFGLLLISLVVGLRYQVGVDWGGYKEGFEYIRNSGVPYDEQSWEAGYFYLNKIFAQLDFPYQSVFMGAALISWWFLFKSVPLGLLPAFIYFLFVDEYFFWSMNGVRQFIALSAWVFAVRFILTRELGKFLFTILIASLFHKSALMLPLFYFLPYAHVGRRRFWIILYLASLIIGSSNQIVEYVQSWSQGLFSGISIVQFYNDQYIAKDMLGINESLQQGLGFWFKAAIDFVLICWSGKVVEKNLEVRVYYFLFAIGAVMFNLTYNVPLLGRLNHYFLIFRPLMLALVVTYYWKSPISKPMVAALCFCYFLVFLYAIYISANMCSPFNFGFMI